ncbi:MAG TPA: SAM-dependent methyltransferase [Methylomirabilota bacterium]|nr:SAM-dependent methyltransferase [Methylomirabilota bacterium]
MNTPINIIREEIEKSGVLPFARFMELALYHPDGGYYEREQTPGRRGDFYTSVSVGNLFGELLAFQFAEWLEAEVRSQKSEVRIVEAGAHDGQLAKDILNWLQIHHAKLFERIEYIFIEPSPRRQQWQRETVKDFQNVEWLSDFENLKLINQNSKLNGIIFSNELLDAFPVHRFGWDAKGKKWFEWGVALDGDKFIWSRTDNFLAPSDGERVGVRGNLPSSIFHLPSSLLDILPDGYTIETSPVAENWWRDAANVLETGRLVAIDYGLAADELFSPARADGTLRAYFQHRVSEDVLANVGEQDLTAHVNFSAIQKVGEDAGLITEFFGAQTKFLTEILRVAAKNNSFGEWNTKQTRQFQTLTHPEHLGRAFRVLVQSKS